MQDEGHFSSCSSCSSCPSWFNLLPSALRPRLTPHRTFDTARQSKRRGSPPARQRATLSNDAGRTHNAGIVPLPRQAMLRIILFIATNLAVMILLTIVVKVTGLDVYAY